MASKNKPLLSVSPRHKPSLENDAARARQLIAKKNQGVNWGVLSTIHTGGSPFGNVVWFSDGARGSGIPYFYLSARDRSLTDAAKDPSTSLPRTSLTVCDDALVTCGQKDTENRTCAILTLSGQLKLVDANSKEATFAKDALAKHPNMKGSHEGHDFQIYKLDIEKVFLIDWVGQATEVDVAEYRNHKAKKSL